MRDSKYIIGQELPCIVGLNLKISNFEVWHDIKMLN